MAKCLLDELQPIVSFAKGPGGITPEMNGEALGIVGKAAELAELFRLTRADYHVVITRLKLPLVRPPSCEFEFDPETMERVRSLPVFEHGNSTPTVNLVVSPGIIKTGRSDGSNYHSDLVLVKLQAVCDLQEIWHSPQK